MRVLSITAASAAVAALAALVAGCSTTSQNLASLPVSSSESTQGLESTHGRPASSYQTLHSFGSGTDGSEPKAGLIDVHGTLYGTTYFGGADNKGTVYAISPTGMESVAHSFSGAPNDGAYPAAGLSVARGALWGTTGFGGITNQGAAYYINSGGEALAHSFGHHIGDGVRPAAGVRYVNGKLYGTTESGGGSISSPRGTVYRLNTDGRREEVLHTFGAVDDGSEPVAGVIAVHGTLYGTTRQGGMYDCTGNDCGTVFSITTRGREKVLHSFGLDRSDGSGPEAGLIDVNGTLYGTTGFGGAYNQGTVYRITTTGKEAVLHSFGAGSDGAGPKADLIEVHGTLYGTTEYGGTDDGGTIYSITATGKETVLHSFGSGSDGKHPRGGLLYVHRTFYGATETGGQYRRGTVFSFKP